MGFAYNCWGEEITPRFVDVHGEVVKRTPYSHPYNYDEFLKWKSADFDYCACSAVYSDRMLGWDKKKFDNACEQVFKNHGQMFGDRNPEDIEKFLSIYLDKEVKLKGIIQGCNQWNGYPYWAFLYQE